MCLRLKIPHCTKMKDLDAALDALVTAAKWNSLEAEEYFRHMLWPIMDSFCAESKEAIKRCFQDRPLTNESFSGLIFTKGAQAGELKLDANLAWNPEGRAFDESDTVWLSLMDSERGIFCECCLTNVNPLVLRGDEENNIFQLALTGRPCRIDKLAARTTFVRTLCALHCMCEPERVGSKKMQKAELSDRLPAKFAPSLFLTKILSLSASDLDRKWWAEETPQLLSEVL